MNEEYFAAASVEDADIVMIGLPFDGTVSFRPGTRFGPAAIRNVLYGIETYSPYQQTDMSELDIFDYGDIEVPIGNTVRTLELIEKTVTPFFQSGKKVLALGGEHLVSLGVIRAALKKYSQLTIIHFDAHVDMRDDYLGEKLSHSTVMRRAGELMGYSNIYQFGIRSGSKDEWDFAFSNSNIYPYKISDFYNVINSFSDGEPIYLTIDLDVLDPSYFPGTGTPEPCGISTRELIDAIIAMEEKNIIGADVVELSPDYDPTGVSSVTAAHIVREVSMIL